MLRPIIFLLLLLVATGVFAMSMSRFVRAILSGRKNDLSLTDRLGARIASVLIYFFAQKKVAEPVSYRTRPGVTSVHHLFIFWGFLIITVGTGEFVLNGLIPAFSFAFMGPVATALYWSMDVFNFLVILMLLYALFRRVVLKPRLIPMSLDARS